MSDQRVDILEEKIGVKFAVLQIKYEMRYIFFDTFKEVRLSEDTNNQALKDHYS